MLSLLWFLPIFISVAALYLYRFSGRREWLNFDVVQFIYAFVLLPVMFIWLKSVLFVGLRSQINIELSLSELFILDTLFSTLYMFVSFFVVIHSLTKSFNLKVTKDPLVDLHDLSEYFHLSFSHFAMYLGVLVLFTVISFINLFFPWSGVTPTGYIAGLWIGAVSGVLFYLSVMNYRVASRQFMRVMKLIFATIFLIHVVGYYVANVSFSPSYTGYWSVLVGTAVLAFMALFVQRQADETGIERYRLHFRKTISAWLKSSHVYLRQRQRS